MKLLFALVVCRWMMAPARASTFSSTSSIIVLEDFSRPLHTWDTMNDPVMGGQSTSSVVIQKNGVAKFTGECANVPFLKAPGFVTMVTGGYYATSANNKESFPDVSMCQALALTIQTNVPYSGYRISFGKERLPHGGHAEGYKAPLLNLPLGHFEQVVIPFSQFSSKWDEATGDIQVTCQDNPTYCPSSKWLQNMETISFWGEGVGGTIDLEIKNIQAVGCTTTATSSSTSLAAANVSSTHVSAGGSILLLAVLALGFMVARQRRRQAQNPTYEEIATEATVPRKQFDLLRL
jgi:Complex I intermediate-associated protein 30 (CIA30)